MRLEGLQLGRYHLVRLLGSGSMGTVYRAEDARIEQQVAIKMLRVEAPLDPDDDSHNEAIRLFQREAMTIARLDHPHILPLYDYGEASIDGVTFIYLVMPLRLEGSLITWLAQHNGYAQLSPQDVAHFVRQAASALQHAHDHGIIHQDTKPGNFLIRQNEDHPYLPDLLLADFGIAKYIAAASHETQSIRGTPAYMAPEQWKGNAEPASDQYALAVMAYQLLTGRLPFLGGQEQIMFQHFHSEPQRPSQLNPRLSAELDEVILCALAKQPQDRFFSIAAFAHAFQRAVQNMDAPTIASTHNTPGIQGRENISATLTISEGEAQRGTSRRLTLPDGQHVSVAIPQGIQDGQVLHFENQQQSHNGNQQNSTILLTIVVSHAEKDAHGVDPNSNELTIQSSFPHQASRPATISSSEPGQASIGLRRGFPRFRAVLLVALALLIVVVSVEFFYLSRAKPGSRVNNPPRITVTAPSTTDPYTGTGKLVLNDPLSDNSQGYSWQTGINSSGAGCQFNGGAYHAVQPHVAGFQTCFAQATNLTNFVYEVQMTITSGDYGGITFYADNTRSTFYSFSIGLDANFHFRRHVDSSITHAQILSQGLASSFYSGLHQPNVLAIVVHNGSVKLYVNHHLVDEPPNGIYNQGQIGVLAGDTGTSTAAADVEFNDVKVWQL